MVAYHGGETELSDTSPETLEKFQQHPWNEGLAATASGPHLGVWGNVADVSRKIADGSETRSFGTAQMQEAAFALPGTEVQPGVPVEHIANPWGGDVLLHSQPHGEDADPRFNPQADPSHFSYNEVQNPEWDKVGGHLNGQPVTYGDVLRTLNKARTERLRGTNA